MSCHRIISGRPRDHKFGVVSVVVPLTKKFRDQHRCFSFIFTVGFTKTFFQFRFFNKFEFKNTAEYKDRGKNKQEGWGPYNKPNPEEDEKYTCQHRVSHVSVGAGIDKFWGWVDRYGSSLRFHKMQDRPYPQKSSNYKQR